MIQKAGEYPQTGGSKNTAVSQNKRGLVKRNMFSKDGKRSGKHGKREDPKRGGTSIGTSIEAAKLRMGHAKSRVVAACFGPQFWDVWARKITEDEFSFLYG